MAAIFTKEEVSKFGCNHYTIRDSLGDGVHFELSATKAKLVNVCKNIHPYLGEYTLEIEKSFASTAIVEQITSMMGKKFVVDPEFVSGNFFLQFSKLDDNTGPHLFFSASHVGRESGEDGEDGEEDEDEEDYKESKTAEHKEEKVPTSMENFKKLFSGKCVVRFVWSGIDQDYSLMGGLTTPNFCIQEIITTN